MLKKPLSDFYVQRYHIGNYVMCEGNQNYTICTRGNWNYIICIVQGTKIYIITRNKNAYLCIEHRNKPTLYLLNIGTKLQYACTWVLNYFRIFYVCSINKYTIQPVKYVYWEEENDESSFWMFWPDWVLDYDNSSSRIYHINL